MPAVSVCDPLAVALRHTLDTAGQSKSSDDLSIGLAGSASRILQTELDYEETDNYRSTVQDHLKNKYKVLSLPKQENSEGSKSKDGASCSKSMEKSKEPRLPEPDVVLYAPDKVNLGWNKNFPVGAGMHNVGNTCYLNSTLQALFHVPALVNWLLSDPHHDSKCEQTDGGGECLTCAVAKTLQISHQKSGDAIRPLFVYDKLKLICRTMVPGQQEDAHEFLRYLLEGMEKAYLARHRALKLDSYSKETTPINQIFGGYIRTEVKCLQCGHVSTTFQHFQDLLLDIRKASTLDEALNGYFSQEHLDNNDYKCEACKRRVPATKQFILERPPKVLCVQLKRFSVLGGKISRHIGFKQTIDMGPYIRRQPGEPSSKLTYRLASLVTHMGPSVNCGHYTAIAQVSNGKYYIFDDPCVRLTSLNSVVSTNAYIMIFEMEPPPSSSSASQTHSGQSVASKTDSSMPKGNTSSSSSSSSLSFPHSNGLTSKLLDSPGGKSMMSSPSKKDDGGSMSMSSLARLREGAPTSPPPPPPPLPISSLARRNIIGPQLPAHLEKHRMYEASRTNKLVDYDGDSSDDDDDKRGSAKSSRDSRDNGFSYSKSNKSTNGYSHSYQQQQQRSSPSVHNGSNGHHYSSLSNSHHATNGAGSSSSSSYSNGSSSRGSSPKNGKYNGDHNGAGSSSNKSNGSSSKDKWLHYSKSSRNESSERVNTKASSAINKGWCVSMDTPSPSSHAEANGWYEPNGNSRSNNHSVTPNAAEMRNFNGTNRSDAVSYLQKSSQWAFGNSNVHSWNGGKSRMDREVDEQCRQVRKRFYNDEDDFDRGRTKKIKFDQRNDYNKFNPYDNHAKWHQHHNYRSSNNDFHGRSRLNGHHGRPPQHYRNKSRHDRHR